MFPHLHRCPPSQSPLLNLTSKRQLKPIDLFYTRLFIQSSFSLIVMFICGYKIFTATEADGQKPVYWSVLSSTAASWMPSPLKQAGEEANDLSNSFSSGITKLERKPEDDAIVETEQKNGGT